MSVDDDLGSDFEDFLNRADSEEDIVKSSIPPISAVQSQSVMDRSQKQLSENRRLLTRIREMSRELSSSNSGLNQSQEFAGDEEDEDEDETSLWLKPKTKPVSTTSDPPPPQSIAVHHPRLNTLKPTVPGTDDEFSSLGTDVPDISLNDDTDDDKEQFFRKIEGDEGDRIDYAQKNIDLAEDSIDIGVVPTVEADGQHEDDVEGAIQDYDEDFEEMLEEDLEEEEGDDVEPGRGDEENDGEEELDGDDFDDGPGDDDLESLQSSIHDIEKSLDMSEREIEKIAPIVERSSTVEVGKAEVVEFNDSPVIKQLNMTPHQLPESAPTAVAQADSSGKPNVEDLEKKLKLAQESSESLKSELNSIKKEYGFLEELLAKERVSVGSLREKLSKTEAIQSDSAAELAILRAENDDLKRTLSEKMKMDQESKSTGAADSKTMREQETLIAGYEKENEKLVKSLKDTENRLKIETESWNRERERLNVEISVLNTRLAEKAGSNAMDSTLESLKSHYESQLITITKENVDKEAKIRSLELSIDKNRKMLEESQKRLRTQLADKENIINGLKSQLMNKNVIEKSAKKTDSKQNLKKMDSTRSVVDKRKVKELEAQVYDLQMERDNLSDKVLELTEKHQTAVEALESEKVDIQKSVSGKVSDLRNEHVLVLRSLQEKARALEELKMDNMKLRASIKETPEGEGNNAYLQQELRDTKERLKLANAKLTQFEGADQTLSELRNVMETLRLDLNTKVAENGRLNSDVSRFENDLRQLKIEIEKKNALLDYHKQQYHDLSSTVDRKQNSEATLRHEFEQASKKLNRLDMENASLQHKLELAETMRNTISEQFKKLVQESHSMSIPTTSQREKDLAVEVQTQAREISDLKKELNRKDASLHESETTVERLQKEESHLKQKIKKTELERLNEDKENRSRMPSAEDEKVIEKLRTENSRLRTQIDVFIKNGGPDVTSWQQLIDQISRLESKIARKQETFSLTIQSALDRSHPNDIDDTWKMEEKYKELLRKKEVQIESLRREMDAAINAEGSI